MQTGYYDGPLIDFSTYKSPKFKFNFDWKGLFFSYGCGANAISSITGETLRDIAEANHFQKHYSDRFMVNYLKKSGHTVIPLTLCAMTQGHTDHILIKNKISRYHVLLISQLFLENEASWIVAHKGKLVHNFDKHFLYPLEFINRPILTAYVVHHKKWS